MTQESPYVRKDVHRVEIEAIRDAVKDIKDDVGEMREGAKWQNRQFITVCITFIAWMGFQLYTNITVRLASSAVAAERVHKP